MKTCKYSVNTNGLRNKYSSRQIVEMAKTLGLDGIEWGLPKFDEVSAAIKEMAQLTSDAGLEVASYINGPHLWKRDDMRRWAEAVAKAGGKSLRVAPPWIAWDYRESLHLKETWHDLFNLARDAMPEVEALARQTGIRFVVELHSGALTASALATVKLFEGVDPKCVGAIYDPANTFLEGNMRPRFEVEVLGPYLAYVHAKNLAYIFSGRFHEEPVRRARWDFRTTHLPYGMVDYLEVFYALKAAGYQGWISSEEYFMEGDDQLVQLRDGLAFLKDCEKNAPGKPEAPYLDLNR